MIRPVLPTPHTVLIWNTFILFSPHHPVHDTRVALDDLHDFCRDVLVEIVGDRQAVVSVLVHRDGCLDGLQQGGLVDASQDEAALLHGFWPLGRGADADSWEGMANGGEEAALLWQGAGVGDDGEGVHLQAVVVVEAQRLVLDDARVELEVRLLQALPASRMAGVEHRHVVRRRHLVDGREQGGEVLLGIDVLLTMCRQQDVPALGQMQALVDIAGFDLLQIGVQDLCHGRAGHIGPLFGQAALGQIAAGVLGVGHVHVGDDVNKAAVRLLGQAFVLAAVARFHMENRDMQALGTDHGQAAVGVAQYEDGIGLDGCHELIGTSDDIAHSGAEVRSHCIQIDLWRSEAQVMEEYAIEVVVVVLSCMGQYHIEVRPALLDHGRQADDLRARAHDDQQLQLAVFLPMDLIKHIISPYACTCSEKVSGCCGSNGSFAHITVTRFSVSDRLMMLWV